MTVVEGARDGRAYCEEVLPRVSRTFAVCIRLLPSGLEHSVLIAYLLCRIADTFEDTLSLPAGERAQLLDHLARCLEDEGPSGDRITAAFPHPTSSEEELVASADIVLDQYRRLPTSHREAVRPWIQEMCEGMAGFVRRRGDAPTRTIEALSTVDELERYCYYVAGTVGQLLTALFREHFGPSYRARYDDLARLAASFGVGLQLTNIIKDVADDRQRGWSFVPRQLCDAAGIHPEDLQNGRHPEAARRVMAVLIDKAKGHLRDALEYSTTLPRRFPEVRQFCLSSLFFAVRTLRLAESDRRLLDPTHKVKISRKDVFRTLRTTRLVARSNSLVRLYFRWLAGERWPRPARSLAIDGTT
jgi:farnesyl-diphosphate farnesyltransferase